MKKNVTLGLILILALVLGACAPATTPAEEKPAEEAIEEPAEEEVKEVKAEPISVCVSLYGKLGDQSYNDSVAEGVLLAAEDLGVENLEFFTKKRPSFAQRLLAFICVEGIFFSGSFCAIYWLKSKGLLPGLATSNNFISRDEALHTEFAIELYTMLDDRLSDESVHSIFKEAVEIETEFITESLPVSLLGMNSTLMVQHIQSDADYWLILLG
ncbi:ribonucleotide-diphosphate reductase subunit beta, partial [Candidatus Bathyarchaeota archaeon]|nr:ribonucleotide-diphosphate reductase subunit beta [Candidatus Bathyarchaeota archaeon]